MKYLGYVPSNAAVICELSREDWENLLAISGIKEGELLADDDGNGAIGIRQRREVLGLAARAVCKIAPCQFHTDSLRWTAYVVNTIAYQIRRDLQYRRGLGKEA